MRCWKICLFGLVILIVAEHATVLAGEAGRGTFMGVSIESLKQDYIVARSVNIRNRPSTAGDVTGSLNEGDRVSSVGRASDSWIAVRHNGKDIGFVFEANLIRILDGTLTHRIVGKVSMAEHPDCQYIIRYQGKSEAQGQPFDIADYDVDWKCQSANGPVEFSTPMFMTEGPYRKLKQPSHQITVDIVDPDGIIDEVVSTTVFYDQERRTVSFDGVSQAAFSGKPDVLEVLVPDLPTALQTAVEMSYQAWSAALWKILLKPSR